MANPLNSDELRALYGIPSGRAAIKVLSALEQHSRNFIGHSPFLILSSYNSDGSMDTSPRGGKKGFVKILDDSQILIPDAKGNNRIDSLINIAETGKVGLLFLLPGIDETLRVNGSAVITNENKYLKMFPDETRPPKTCILIKIEEVFLHCAKALMRSKLWNPTFHLTRPAFPTMGKMLKDQLGGDKPLETQEEMVKRYKKDL